jgi:hypothetical protein
MRLMFKKPTRDIRYLNEVMTLRTNRGCSVDEAWDRYLLELSSIHYCQWSICAWVSIILADICVFGSTLLIDESLASKMFTIIYGGLLTAFSIWMLTTNINKYNYHKGKLQWLVQK